MDNERNLMLCLVKGNWAWFTTQRLETQWGDDWNDVPYEHNAGDPYTPTEQDKAEGRDWQVVRVAWDGPLYEPCDGTANSIFSVEKINRAWMAPWLRSMYEPGNAQHMIWAGTTLDVFKQIVKAAGGHVWESEDDTEMPPEPEYEKIPQGAVVQFGATLEKDAVLPLTITFTQDGKMQGVDFFDTVVFESEFKNNA